MNEKIAAALGFDAIRKKLADRALSTLGREAALCLTPEWDPAEALRLTRETAEAQTLAISQPAFPIMGFDDVSSEIRRLRSQGSLNCAELLKIAFLLRSAKRAFSNIRRDAEGRYRLLPEIASELFYDDHACREIETAILSEDELADDASAELKSIRRKIRSENDSIRDHLQSIIRSRELGKYLQDAIVTQRSGRYVVPVKQEYRSSLKGMIHGESASGATVFIEPMSIVEANNRLRTLEEEERREIERILMRLSNLVRPFTAELSRDMEVLTRLDLIFAKSTLALSMDASPCDFSDDGLIDVKRGRHPLIDKQSVIPISVRFSEHTLLITGPNTGGKTVTLKLIGLFALMAQSGLFLPAAQGSRLPVFSGVFADIGDEQSIEQSLSTFSSHMTTIISILEAAEDRSLVLLDELGAGTDPEEGAALGMAILKELAERGSKTVATTHYSEIKAYAMSTPGCENAGMEFDPYSLKPTYRLVMGVAGASNALLVSEGLGLPKRVAEQARAFMSAERLEMESLLLEAERTRSRAMDELHLAEQKQKQAEAAEQKARALEEELESRREAALEKAKRQALEIVNDAREEAESVIRDLRAAQKLSQSEATKVIDVSRRKLNAKRERYELKPRATAVRQAIHAEALKVGDPVIVISLDAPATVLSLPDSRGLVSVQAGIMKLSVPVADLAARKESSKEKPRRNHVSLAQRSPGLSIDLHGYNVEEALIELDKYLDDAFLCGLTEVSIIHGKGTGTLRQGIQAFLRRHPHVEKFRAGKYGEGENGVTVVTLK